MPPPREADTLLTRLTRWASSMLENDEADADGGDSRRRAVRKDATVRRTRQITNMDCGIAALSMLVDVPYAKARTALFSRGERCLGTDHRRMRAALRAFGVLGNARFRKFKSWTAITSHALVHIRWRQLPPSDPGHWVVMQKLEKGYRVLDPASYADTLAASDTSAMRGVSFLPVDLVQRAKKSKAAATSERDSERAAATPRRRRSVVKA